MLDVGRLLSGLLSGWHHSRDSLLSAEFLLQGFVDCQVLCHYQDLLESAFLLYSVSSYSIPV